MRGETLPIQEFKESFKNMPLPNKYPPIGTYSLKTYVILFFILAATSLSFYPSLLNDFTTWDDRVHVLENPEIRVLDWDHIKTIFTSTASHGYIPLTIFSFNIEHHFFGLNPFVYHLDNLLLHLAVTALIFFLGLRLGLDAWASGLAALLFGIHPMHVESVAWISERKDVLYAVFYMLALYSYWMYLEAGRKKWYALSIVCGFLSMLAKPMALSLPLVLLLLDWMRGRPSTFKIFLEKLPYCFYIVPIMSLTYGFYSGTMTHDFSLEVVLTWIWTMMFYIQKFLFPSLLAPLYTLPQPVVLWNPVYLTAVLSMIVSILIMIRFRSHRWLIFAVLFYLCSIFFLFRVNLSEFIIVADRYMYLPSVGFCFLFGYAVRQGLIRLGEKRNLERIIVVMCLVVVFGVLSVKTFLQCKIWKDSVTFWSEVIRYKPDFFQAYQNRGVAFLAQGREDEALLDLNKTVLINPAFAEAYGNRALIYYHRKQYDLALMDLNRALKLKPDFLNGYGNRGLVYASMKQHELAIKDYNRGLQIDSSAARLYYYRSVSYANLQQFGAAMSDAKHARVLGYRNTDEYINQLEKYAPER